MTAQSTKSSNTEAGGWDNLPSICTPPIRPPQIYINNLIYQYDGKFYRQYDGQILFGDKLRIRQTEVREILKGFK